jgi:hypothetical protein
VLNRGDKPTKATNIFDNIEEKQGTSELFPYLGQPTEIADSGYCQDRKLEQVYNGGRVLRCVTQMLLIGIVQNTPHQWAHSGTSSSSNMHYTN